MWNKAGKLFNLKNSNVARDNLCNPALCRSCIQYTAIYAATRGQGYRAVCYLQRRKLKMLKAMLKDECPVEALRACVFIYLPYILKNNVEFRRK